MSFQKQSVQELWYKEHQPIADLEKYTQSTIQDRVQVGEAKVPTQRSVDGLTQWHYTMVVGAGCLHTRYEDASGTLQTLRVPTELSVQHCQLQKYLNQDLGWDPGGRQDTFCVIKCCFWKKKERWLLVDTQLWGSQPKRIWCSSSSVWYVPFP